MYSVEARIIEGMRTIGFRLSDNNGKLYDYPAERILEMAALGQIKNAVLLRDRLAGNNFNLNKLKKINVAELIKKEEAINTIFWKNRKLTVVPFSIRKAYEYIKHISRVSEAHNEVIAFYMPDNLREYGGNLSSGALPKWDFKKIFVKAAGLDKKGNDDNSAVNESYIYRTFSKIGINIANAFPIVVVFREDSGQIRIAEASISMKFKGNLEYYRDIRNSLREGNFIFSNSELYDFIARYPLCKDDFIKMCLLDIMVYQEDRHVKNFGVIGDKMAPLYDNGASLGYDSDYIGNSSDVGFKAFGKKYIDVIQEVSEIKRFSISISGKVLEKGLLSSRIYFKNIIDNKKLRQVEEYITNSIRVINHLEGVRIC
jgi:hypothetical protein